MQPEHSRVMRLAAETSAQGETSLLEHLAEQHVAVAVTADQPADLAGAELLLLNLARLPIVLTPELEGLPSGARQRLENAAIPPGAGRITADAEPPITLRVRVGRGGDADLYGAADHHGAHVSHSPIAVAREASGLGAVTCAALLSGEVFKAITPILPGRGRALEEMAWCPVTLGDNPGSTPMLDDPLELDVALIGLGAVGSAIARILGLMGATGHASLVDPERFAIENVGTYSLGDRREAQNMPWKTELAARALPSMTTARYDMPVAGFIERIDAGAARWPSVVLTGLDSVDARRDAQMLWPERLLDAATGDTMCGLHDVGPRDRACLRCLFPVASGGPSAAQRLATATGLDAEILRHGDQLLRLSDLAKLDESSRSRVAGHVGKPICGLAQAIGLTELRSDDYRPSVPFVSQQAACLSVGRLIADSLGLPKGATFVQYDALSGPDAGTFEDRAPLPSCYCQQRAGLVGRLRAHRASSAE